MSTKTITLQFPESALAALRRSPAEMSGELRRAAALFWYSRGVLSQERAAEVADLSRSAFIEECRVNKVEAVVVDLDEIRREHTA